MRSGTIQIFLCFCSVRTTCGPNVSLHAQLLAYLIRENAAISLPAWGCGRWRGGWRQGSLNPWPEFGVADLVRTGSCSPCLIPTGPPPLQWEVSQREDTLLNNWFMDLIEAVSSEHTKNHSPADHQTSSCYTIRPFFRVIYCVTFLTQKSCTCI